MTKRWKPPKSIRAQVAHIIYCSQIRGRMLTKQESREVARLILNSIKAKLS